MDGEAAKESYSPKAFGARKKSYGDYCCVPGCTNQRGKDKDLGIERSYYRFPKETRQKTQWLKLIRRDNWEPKNHDRICSDHFEGGIKKTSSTEKGYLPTLFPHKKKTEPRKTNNSSIKELQVLNGQSENKKRLRRKRLFEETESQVGRPSESKSVTFITPSLNNHDYIVTNEEKGNYNSIKEYLPEIKEKINELDHLKRLNENQRKQILSLNNIRDNPKRVNFWTGFPNYETFEALFHYFEPRAKSLHYWRGDATMPDEFSQKKKGPERKLLLIDEFFLTMVRLKVGLLYEDLAVRFSISIGSVSSIFSSWINLMYVDLKELCELPSKEVLVENQSESMKGFSDVRIILDCTEIFVQNPTKLEARKQVFSKSTWRPLDDLFSLFSQCVYEAGILSHRCIPHILPFLINKSESRRTK